MGAEHSRCEYMAGEAPHIHRLYAFTTGEELKKKKMNIDYLGYDFFSNAPGSDFLKNGLAYKYM